jgi:hypothetical protein
MSMFDDFIDGGVSGTVGAIAAFNGKYEIFGSSGATITYDEAFGGGLVLTEATADESVGITMAAHPYQISSSGDVGSLWFEARIKSSTITASEQTWFVGLMDTTPLSAAVPITATGILAATMNLVGFHMQEANTTAYDTVYIADAIDAVEIDSDVGAVAVDTYFKLGMFFDSLTGLLHWYINGVEQATTMDIPDDTGTDFPADVRLAPCVAMAIGTGTSETITMDWWKCAQLFEVE